LILEYLGIVALLSYASIICIVGLMLSIKLVYNLKSEGRYELS
jgi:hypothetical protein